MFAARRLRILVVTALLTTAAALGAALSVTAGTESDVGAPRISRADWDDFDGDGYADLAIGMPFKMVSGDAAAGEVRVIYGGPGGLHEAGDETWHQDVPDVVGAPEPNDHFGWAVAAGDFNDDEFGDLAIGVPHEDWGPGESDYGGVTFLYGWAGGLRPNPDHPFLGPHDLYPAVRPGWEFGYALAGISPGAGQDSFRLAIGAPGAFAESGTVFMVGPRYVNDDTSYPIGHERLHCDLGQGARLGSSVAAGRLAFAVSGPDFVAAGAPFADVTRADDTVWADAGAVCVSIPREDSQLHRTYRQGHELPGTPETGDRLGTSVAIGDLSGDGRDELAIGIPFEDEGATTDAGRVTIIPGSDAGPVMGNAYQITLASPGMPGAPTPGDRLGSSLLIANLGGPSLRDLAIGLPGSDAGAPNAGSVIVRYSGRPVSETQRWNQNGVGIVDEAQRNDRFGSALAAGDFDDDADADLAVGVLLEDFGSAVDAGAVSVIYATSANGLSATGNEIWHQGASGIGGTNTSADRFGFALD